MQIIFTTRHFYPDELQLLTTMSNQKEKQQGSRIKFYHFVMAAFLGAGSAYLASIPPDSFWTFLFGTIAVFSFGFIVFVPYELYKLKKSSPLFLQQIDTYIDKGTVDACVVNATSIAVAREYEDEGDLFIIEYDTNKVLYLWDNDYNLRKTFPCLQFEIYEESFSKLFGRQVYPLSERISPLVIHKTAKWNYMKKNGVPGHLETENKNLDELIAAFNNCT